MASFLTIGLESLSSILFPPLCAACKEPLTPGFHLFCEECLMTLTLLGEEGRCHRCFCPREEHNVCGFCRELPKGLRQQAACFEESPVSQELFSFLRRGIATTAVAGYIVLQLERLRWPLPDLVIPTPGDWIDINESWEVRNLLAKEVAELLKRPYANCTKLNRHLLPLRYACLETQPPGTSSTALRSSSETTNKTVLLIHDAYKTGRAIALTATSLEEAGARAVYALSFSADASSTIT